jgi:tRNA(His) 5'-end guanylyltransferase
MGDNTDDLGDRMKTYESFETSRRFLPFLPIYARIDGRGFSKFTKNMERPFDPIMHICMIETLKVLVEQTHATIGYTQSDEISLMWIPEGNGGNPWFDNKITKMTSVLAGLASSAFFKSIAENFDPIKAKKLHYKLPHFDARVISLPTVAEAANMLLWRNLDCLKNSVSMAAHHYFSHKSLQGLKSSEMQERLFQEAGVNFNDYPTSFKRGTWVRRETVQKAFAVDELEKIPAQHRPDSSTLVTRTVIQDFDLPPLNKISNKADVLFKNAAIQFNKGY